jgi:hypothetical protein
MNRMPGRYVAVGIGPWTGASVCGAGGAGLDMEMAEAPGIEALLQPEMMRTNTMTNRKLSNRCFTRVSKILGCQACLEIYKHIVPLKDG